MIVEELNELLARLKSDLETIRPIYKEATKQLHARKAEPGEAELIWKLMELGVIADALTKQIGSTVPPGQRPLNRTCPHCHRTL
jgi:hypothetical protein